MYPYSRYQAHYGGVWFLNGCGQFFQPYSYGIMLLSKYPFTGYTWTQLPRAPGDPAPLVAQLAAVDANGISLALYNTHFIHDSEGVIRSASRLQQAYSLASYISATRATAAVFAGGDFNATRDSAEMQPLRNYLLTSIPNTTIDIIWTSTTDSYLPPLDVQASDHAMQRVHYLWCYGAWWSCDNGW